MKKVSFTDEQKQYVKDNYDKKTINEMRNFLKIGAKTFSRMVEELGLGKKRLVFHSIYTESVQAEIIKRYATTDTVLLSNELGISPANIRQWARNHGLKKKKGYVYRDTGKSRMSKEQKRWVFDNYSIYSNEYISEYLGVPADYVRAFACRKGLTKNPNVVSGAMSAREVIMSKRKDVNYDVYDFLGKEREPKIESSELFKSNMGKYYVNNNYFRTIDNEWKAYWLGFLYADGCNDMSNSCIRLKLQIRDIEHVKSFRDSLQSDSSIKTFFSDQRIVGGRCVGPSELCAIYICNAQLCQQLNNLGCIPNKTYVLQFPSSEQVPDKFMRHFIRGFLDGDGWISYSKKDGTPYVGFVGMEQFLVPLRDFIVKKCGVETVATRERKTRKSAAKEISWSSFLDCEKIYNYLYNDCNIYLERKLKKFDEVFCLGQFKCE